MTSDTNSTVGIALLVNIVADALAHFGVVIGTPELTTTIQGLILIGSSLIVYFKHKATQRALANARLSGFSGK